MPLTFPMGMVAGDRQVYVGIDSYAQSMTGGRGAVTFLAPRCDVFARASRRCCDKPFKFSYDERSASLSFDGDIRGDN